MAEEEKGNDFILEIDVSRWEHTLKDGKLQVKVNSWDNGIHIKSIRVLDEREETKSWKYLGVGDRGGVVLW